MRSWVFRNRARLEALYGRASLAPRPTTPEPVSAGAEIGTARSQPGVVVLVPAKRRLPGIR